MEPIAVIGLGCRFPSAPNIDSLWELICSGRDVLCPAPEGRYLDLAAPEFRQSDVGLSLRGLRGGFLDGIDLFDPVPFRISPREARVVDPQQRLLLETAWEALEDAGQDMRRLGGGPVGVYVGVWGSDYQARLFRAAPRIDIAMTTGGGRYAAAGRLSYSFDFRGPSMTIDTACSSSLVSIHMACQALRAGECALAIAGGVNVILDSAVTIGYLAAGALSPDGRCKFGDASADGYARSEGAGVVVLKTLRAALADGDPVHAIIRGSAVSHNGQTGGSLLAPGEEGQLQLLKQALAAADVRPAEIDYIEAHGTGTKVGDRMELRALGALLSEGRKGDSQPCLIGSIKTNIGHAESAAGVAGLIKAILCLKHREVPASLHFLNPNPDVPWAELPLRIVTKRTPLRSGGGPAIAGVNSFGITGAFAHVILEEAPAKGTRGGLAPAAGGPVLLPISALGGTALAGVAGAFARQIRSAPGEIANVAYSAALRRSHHEVRMALAGRDADSMADALEAFALGEPAPGLSTPPEPPPGEPRVGWIFSGQGPQWAGMGRQLFEAEPVFRATIERLEELIQAQTGWSLVQELNAPEGASKLDVTAIAQPAIFSIQIALAELFGSWGLRPAMILGHSVGEAAAACTAGILTLEEGVRLICARARIAEQASGLGRMAAVEMSVAEARELIQELGGTLSLAAVNAPRSLTISGPLPILEKFCERTATLGRFWRVLDVNYPFHSALLDPLLPQMAAIGEGIPPRAPHTPLYSSVHGRLAAEKDFTPAYWPRNLRDTVLFGPAVEQMAAAGCNAFVEMSPHPVLSYSIRQVLQSMGRPGCVVETLRRAGDEPVDVRKAVGDLYVLGCDPDWKALAPPSGKPVPLPGYCWQRESYWIDERPGLAAAGPLLDPFLQKHLRGMGDSGVDYWEAEIGLRAFPWLAEHCVQRRAVFPAAAYLLPALKAAGRLMPGAMLADVELHEALFVPPEGTVSMQFRFEHVDDGTYAMAIHAGDPARPELARKHLSGRVRSSGRSPEPARLDPAGFGENGSVPRGQEAVYAGMHRRRLDYGEAFRGIAGIRHGRGAALARLTLPPMIEAERDRYGIHPATFDACLQTLVALTPGWPEAGDPWMPQGVRELTLRKMPAAGSSLLAWARLVSEPAGNEIAGDVFLLEESGEVLLAAHGVRLQRVSRERDSAEWLHEVRWIAQRLQPEAQSGDADFMPSPAELERRMEMAKPAPGEQASIRAAMTELDRIGGLSVQRALEELGMVFAPGRRFTQAEAAAKTGIAASHRRLFGRMLQILGEDGVLSRDGDAWRVARVAEGDLAAELRGARSLNNGFAPLLDIFKRTSLNLAGVLAGRVNAVELLFGGDGAGTLEALYATHPGWQAPLRQVAQAVAAVVERLPKGRRLRVLEIGAGTGGLTSHLLPLMPADRAEYHFTDLSSFFLARALEKFRAYPFLKEGTLDIERDPVSQGFAAGSFDLVVAANCLHATRDLRKAVEHAGQLLAPGGWLLLQEETAAERWTDLIFGLTDGWWRFDDGELRPDHPLLAPRRWTELLREEGFTDAAVIGGQAGDACGAAVVLGRKPRTRRWLLLGDSGGVAGQLGRRLAELGQSSEIAEPGTTWTAPPDVPGRTVVDLRALDASVDEGEGSADLSATEERVLGGFLDLVHRLADDVHPPRLALVTRESQATGLEHGPLALAQATLWTVARVAALEHSRAPITRIDLDAGPIESQIAALAEELLRGDGEPEVAFRHGNRLVRRLHRLPLPADTPIALNIVRRGSLDGVEARPDEPNPPGADEVQIRVAAAGMNFRDLLNVLGAVDAVPLGLECSGVVTATGKDVRDFSVGDEVMAAGLGTWRTYFNAPSALVAAKPAGIRHEQAAALPIAYLTADYALRHVAGIRRGQRVLIHSAAGGVGLAAVHLALAAGATVCGTAGSPAKRDFLSALGVQHVFDSRSLRFSEEITAMGGGLDVVLNCFTGEFIPRSLDLLAEGGHFVEIGKRDIWSKIQVAERRPDVQYNVLELAEMMRNAPETLRPMLRRLAAELAGGVLPPLPIRAFPMSQAVQALGHMQQARHTGKIVLKAPGCDFSKGSWLVTGGLGGLGIAVAEWLAERGVRQILLVGRQAPHEEALAAIERCAARGCRVLTARCDVADEGALRAVLERAAAELGPLGGVFHMAGVLDDAPVRNLDGAGLAKVYGPKVIGAWNLHRLTRDMPLEAFVLFSSWTALTGSPGQASHASASAFLDALAHSRREMGLPGQAINWGGWSEVGSAARPERLAHLARQGAGGLSTAEALEALGRVIGSDAIQVGVSPFDAAIWRASTGNVAAGRLVEEMVDDGQKQEETKAEPELPLREALLKAPPGTERRQVMEGCIQRRLARVLRMPATKFDVRKPFKHLGLDSLGALEIRNALEGDVGRKLPASLVYNHATVASLAAGLAAEMGIPLDEVDGVDVVDNVDNEGDVAALLGALRELPEEEALRLLGQDGGNDE